MVLSQSGVQLYETVDDAVNEIKNKDFQNRPNQGQYHSSDRKSDGENQNDLITPNINKINKAVNFVQPVKMQGERNFELIDNPEITEAIDDITSNIIWKVLSKKDRAVFTAQYEIKDLGKIALKTRC